MAKDQTSDKGEARAATHEPLISENRFRRLLTRAVIWPVALVSVFCLALFYQGLKATNARAAADANQELIREARDVRTSLLDMETGVRGFLLTPKQEFLNPYLKEEPRLELALDRLVNNSGDDPVLLKTARTLRDQGKEWDQKVSAMLDAKRTNPDGAGVIKDLSESKELFDHIRTSLNTYLAREDQLQITIQDAFYHERTQLFRTLILGAIALAMGLALCSVLVLRSLAEKYHKATTAYGLQVQRAREAADLYQLIAENSEDLISLIDRFGRYTYVSPSHEKVLGYKREDLLDKSFLDLVHREDVRNVLQQWKMVGLTGSGMTVLRLKSANGDYRWIEETGSHVDGNMVGVGRDVTDRVQAEHEILKLNSELEKRVIERTGELARTNKELEAFSYSVSHDLRAPLRSIASFSMILQEDLEGKIDDDSQDNLDRIRSAAGKMTELIDALLKFSRIARVELARTEVDVSQMAESIGADFKQQYPARSVEVRVEPGLTDQADAHLVRIVLENLIGNSWKFTGNNPNARIEFGRKDGIYFLTDNGVGFEQEYVHKVFLPFERLHTEREFPGTGIGLATTKRIIDRHGGNIWAESEVGKGTTFWFTLGPGIQ